MKILFVCKGNSFRSQIAEALYNNMTGTHDATSAGTYPGAKGEPEGSLISAINKGDEFTDMMLKKGFDLRERRTVRLTPEMHGQADTVISMAQEPYIPDFLRNDPKVMWWDVADVPFGTPREMLRSEMEKVFEKIKVLIQELLN